MYLILNTKRTSTTQLPKNCSDSTKDKLHDNSVQTRRNNLNMYVLFHDINK